MVVVVFVAGLVGCDILWFVEAGEEEGGVRSLVYRVCSRGRGR